jgi:hypothetical protein
MTRPPGAQGGAETERLLLLPWTEEYSGDFARICADPEAMRFISGGRPLTDDDIRAIIDRTLAMWDQYGYGPWAAIDKQTGQWAGRIGLSLLADWPGPDNGKSASSSPPNTGVADWRPRAPARRSGSAGRTHRSPGSSASPPPGTAHRGASWKSAA